MGGRHLQQFCEALNADDTAMLSDFTEVPNSPVIGPQQLAFPPHGHRVRKVSALSDFAPVNLKVKKCVLLELLCMFRALTWKFKTETSISTFAHGPRVALSNLTMATAGETLLPCILISHSL